MKKLIFLCPLCIAIGLLSGCTTQGEMGLSNNSSQIAAVSLHDVGQSVQIGRTTDMGILMNYGSPCYHEQAVSGEKRYIYRFLPESSNVTNAAQQIKQIAFSFSRKNILIDWDYFDSTGKKTDGISSGRKTPVSGDQEIVRRLNSLKAGMLPEMVINLLGLPFIGTAKTYFYSFQRKNDLKNPISLSVGFSRKGKLSHIVLDSDYIELIRPHSNIRVPVQSIKSTRIAKSPYILNKDEIFAISCFENNRKTSNASIDLAQECLQKIAMTSTNGERRITASTITQDDIDKSVRIFSRNVDTAFQIRNLGSQVKNLRKSHTGVEDYINVYQGASALVGSGGESASESAADLDDFSDIDDFIDISGD
ncbi:MAG: hypothetical protein NC112_06600 [Oxalobacter formigenes]|nr:hypothetical protein [Oxalobacter formigenes]